jgi:hypothetical protein
MILEDNPNIDDQIVGLRVMVACESNANGEPDFYFCKVNCRRAAYNAGEHYHIAEQKAEKEGYEGKMVSFDEHDSAGRAIVDHFVWESADVLWHWPTA